MSETMIDILIFTAALGAPPVIYLILRWYENREDK